MQMHVIYSNTTSKNIVSHLIVTTIIQHIATTTKQNKNNTTTLLITYYIITTTARTIIISPQQFFSLNLMQTISFTLAIQLVNQGSRPTLDRTKTQKGSYKQIASMKKVRRNVEKDTAKPRVKFSRIYLNYH